MKFLSQFVILIFFLTSFSSYAQLADLLTTDKDSKTEINYTNECVVISIPDSYTRTTGPLAEVTCRDDSGLQKKFSGFISASRGSYKVGDTISVKDRDSGKLRIYFDKDFDPNSSNSKFKELGCVWTNSAQNGFYSLDASKNGCSDLNSVSLPGVCAGTVLCGENILNVVCEASGNKQCPTADECYFAQVNPSDAVLTKEKVTSGSRLDKKNSDGIFFKKPDGSSFGICGYDSFGTGLIQGSSCPDSADPAAKKMVDADQCTSQVKSVEWGINYPKTTVSVPDRSPDKSKTLKANGDSV